VRRDVALNSTGEPATARSLNLVPPHDRQIHERQARKVDHCVGPFTYHCGSDARPIGDQRPEDVRGRDDDLRRKRDRRHLPRAQVERAADGIGRSIIGHARRRAVCWTTFNNSGVSGAPSVYFAAVISSSD
jgi:hypothetical protein